MYSCWGKLMIQLTENQSDNYVGLTENMGLAVKGVLQVIYQLHPGVSKCMNLHSKGKKGGNRHRDVGVMCRWTLKYNQPVSNLYCIIDHKIIFKTKEKEYQWISFVTCRSAATICRYNIFNSKKKTRQYEVSHATFSHVSLVFRVGWK